MEGGSIMRRSAATVMAVAIAVVATACYQDFDFGADHKADRYYVDEHDDWWDATTGTKVLDAEPGDRPVPADWDGDHIWDKALLRPNGDWVTGSTVGTIHFPAPAQLPDFVSGTASGYYFILPVPGDYDGDGRADPAWYRDSDATWFIEGMAPVVFGSGPTEWPPGGSALDLDQDFPVPADYDGDGITDLATFNPRTLAWSVRSSADGSIETVVMQHNQGLPLPVPADFDDVDHAQRATAGYEGWDIEGHELVVFGETDGNYPAVADYDGDGRADLSYTNGTGIWRTQGSTEELDIVPGSAANYDVFPLTMSRNLIDNIGRFTYVGMCHFDPAYCEGVTPA